MKSQEDIQSLRELEKYIHEELNVKLVTFSLDKDKYGLTLKVEPDHKTLGPRLKSKAKKITDILKVRELTLLSMHLPYGQDLAPADYHLFTGPCSFIA